LFGYGKVVDASGVVRWIGTTDEHLPVSGASVTTDVTVKMADVHCQFDRCHLPFWPKHRALTDIGPIRIDAHRD
jgi:hypothetical protein